MGGWRKRGLALACGAAITAGAAAVAPAAEYFPVCLRSTAAVNCGPYLNFQLEGGFAPKKLLKLEMAPVAVYLEGRVENSDGTRPPALEEVTLDLDRNTAVNAVGLPACGKSRLEALGVEAARRACREAIVGSGVAHFMVESPQPRVIELPLTFFNGGVRGGVTTLFLHSSIVTLNSAPVVAITKLRRASKGVYRLEAVTKIPPIASKTGSVLDFSLTVKRLFEQDGLRSGYVMARCADDRLQARETLVFSDGTVVGGTLLRGCTPRPHPDA